MPRLRCAPKENIHILEQSATPNGSGCKRLRGYASEMDAADDSMCSHMRYERSGPEQLNSLGDAP